jgi:hypothetical protein
MGELRTLFTVQIVRGGLLRSDGVGVGLVGGGAPPWELMSRAARSRAGADYHRLLLALDAPLDLYLFEQPHDVADAIGALLRRQDRALDEGRVAHADVLGAVGEYLADLSRQGGSRARQVVWAITSSGAPALPGPAGLGLGDLLRGGRADGASPGQPERAGRAALAQALERARRLAEALSALGGSPPARLLEPEEIARLLYRQADPVRSQRYPLSGALLDRVRRVVGAAPQGE